MIPKRTAKSIYNELIPVIQYYTKRDNGMWLDVMWVFVKMRTNKNLAEKRIALWLGCAEYIKLYEGKLYYDSSSI